MQLISYTFVALWMLIFALYYLVPKKYQWYILLAASLLFYVIGLKGFPLGLLLTGITTYGCGIYLKKSLEQEKAEVKQCADKESRKTLKAVFPRKRKRIQILYIAFNLGLLLFYKYVVILLPYMEKLTGTNIGFLEKVIMPLGISFYTLTAIGYVVDAGRENCQVETNFLKVLLFLSYFPAVTQGPFNRFGQMKEQFVREHVFQYDRMLRGIQRFVWGVQETGDCRPDRYFRGQGVQCRDIFCGGQYFCLCHGSLYAAALCGFFGIYRYGGGCQRDA